jgi:hypothetical protein
LTIDEAAVLCYGYDATNDEWIPILVDATGQVEVTT